MVVFHTTEVTLVVWTWCDYKYQYNHSYKWEMQEDCNCNKLMSQHSKHLVEYEGNQKSCKYFVILSRISLSQKYP